MSRNNTGNPIGSKAFPDFEDNVKNLDEAVNAEQDTFQDRLGKSRLTWAGMENQFDADQTSREQEFDAAQSSRDDQFQSAQSSRDAVFSDFLQASGYQDLGEYAPGIEITAHNQYVTFGGQPYLLKPSIPVPYTTSGAWTGDDFKLIGDDSLRQDLANPDKGAAMVARGVVAVDSTADLLALPEGQRKEGLRYLVKGYYAGSDVGGGEFYYDASSAATPDEGNVMAPIPGQPGRFVRPMRAVVLLDEFGAAPHLSPAENALRITTCLNALTDGQALGQVSDEILSESVSKTATSRNNHLEFRLKASSGGSSIFTLIENSPGVRVSGRLDADNNGRIVLRMRACPGAVCGRDLWLGNIHAATGLSAGLLMNDCDDSEVRCTIENIYCENSAARGVMISDHIIKKNTSTIAPTVKNIISTNALEDGDGIYAEYTTEGYTGGLKIVGGHYEDCNKRYIKVTSPRPTIAGNTGRSSLAGEMRALISSYDEQAGDIYDNDMESGLAGAAFGVDMGGMNTQYKKFNVGPNRLVSKVVAPASRAFGISGLTEKGSIRVGECSGFQALLTQLGESSYSGQNLQIGDGTFDDYAASARNGVTVVGDFQKLKIHDIECVNDTTGYYFVSASDLSDHVAEIVDNRHGFSYGRLFGGARELNAWEKGSAELNGERVVCGTKVRKRNSLPTGAARYRVGDRIERQTITVDANDMVLTGWICIEDGAPGTWAALRSSTVSPAT